MFTFLSFYFVSKKSFSLKRIYYCFATSIEFVLYCYQSQLDEKEKSHQEEINKLKEEVESLRKQKQEKHEEISVICDPVSPVTAECSSPMPVLVKSSSPLLERGDGEVCSVN